MKSYKYKANGVWEIENEFRRGVATRLDAALKKNGYEGYRVDFENPASGGWYDYKWHLETSFDITVRGDGRLTGKDAMECGLACTLDEFCLRFCDTYDEFEVRAIVGEDGFEGYRCKITA